MRQFNVYGVQRQGFEGVWRAGRLWRSGSPTTIEVLDQDECPTIEVDDKNAPNGKRRALDPVRLGLKAFAQLDADHRITIKPVGEVDADDAGKLRDALAAAEKDRDRAVSKAKAEADGLRAERDALAARVKELETQVAEYEALINEPPADVQEASAGESDKGGKRGKAKG